MGTLHKIKPALHNVQRFGSALVRPIGRKPDAKSHVDKVEPHKIKAQLKPVMAALCAEESE